MVIIVIKMAKMTKHRWPVFVLAIFLLLSDQTVGEIHRAKAIKSVVKAKTQLPLGSTTNFLTDSENGVVSKFESEDDMDLTEDGTVFAGSRREAWIYSLAGSVLVGLSGIFPLLVIPIEAGPALKHGEAAKKLKLLLSFAVGGLLGDVFLHLLPEAWAHVNGPHSSEEHTKIGLWVLTGILTFLILEKIFAADDEFEVLDDDDDNESEKTTSIMGESIANKDSKIRQRITGSQKSEVNGNANCLQGKESSTAASGNVCNGGSRTPTSSPEKKPNIKVSGYLNLMANCIDNFTHGLAVAGSFLVSTKVGVLTTFAILIHEIPHEVGDFAILLRSGFNRWKAAKAQMATASGGILGAIFALTADSAQAAGFIWPTGIVVIMYVHPYFRYRNVWKTDSHMVTKLGDQTAWILPFTSGGFIYIALVTVVPDLLHEKCFKESVKQIACLLAGISAMLLVTLLVE